jgi:hypothetical protein
MSRAALRASLLSRLGFPLRRLPQPTQAPPPQFARLVQSDPALTEQEDSMRLELTDEEIVTLRSMLHDYLPDLRREVAATDARDMRHELIKRQDLCERLLEQLQVQLSS